MTEAQMFRKAARLIEKGHEFDSEMTKYICHTLIDVSFAWWGKGCARVRAHLNPGWSTAYTKDVFTPLKQDEKEGRVLACLWLALEAEEEARGKRQR